MKKLNWTVLFIGGASGVGKSSIAQALGQYFQVNVMEVDDIYQAVKAMTTAERYPAIHYWSTGVDWKEIGINGNVDWLIEVSKEMVPSIQAIVDSHIEGNVPVIIEGDFIHPELVASFKNPRIKAFFLHESDRNQITQNYFAREGGELQQFRAEVSLYYGDRLADFCSKTGIPMIEARPWDSAIQRILDGVLGSL